MLAVYPKSSVFCPAMLLYRVQDKLTVRFDDTVIGKPVDLQVHSLILKQGLFQDCIPSCATTP